MGNHSCLTIASTSYRNYFRYVDVPFTEHANKNALSLAKNLSVFSSKLFVTVPAVSVRALI